ncbi:hypothetical protein HAV_00714 [Candidatus Hepatincola sp. Av]
MAIKIFKDTDKNILVFLPLRGLNRVFIDIKTQTHPLVINDRCKHRGGPLHLCKKDNKGIKRCIWHNLPLVSFQKSNDVGIIKITSKKEIKLVINGNDSIWPVKFIN